MILLVAVLLLTQPHDPADPPCPEGAVLVVRVHPEYRYMCAWPEQLQEPRDPAMVLPPGAYPPEGFTTR